MAEGLPRGLGLISSQKTFIDVYTERQSQTAWRPKRISKEGERMRFKKSSTFDQGSKPKREDQEKKSYHV